MTAAQTPTTSGGPETELEVSITRVAVFIGEESSTSEELAEPTGVEFDYAMPSTLALVAVVEDLKSDLSKELHARRLPPLKPRTTYVLCSSNTRPLDLQKTLDECGVVDGDMLWLLPQAATERHSRVVERLSTGVARSAQEQFRTVDAQIARRIAGWGAAALTAWTEIVLARLWWDTGSWIPAAVSAALAAVLIGAAWVASGSPSEERRKIAGALAWISVIALVSAAAFAVPGEPSGWNVAAAAAMLVVSVVLLELFTGRYPAAAAFCVTLGLVAVTAAAAVAGLHARPERIAVAVITVVVVLVTLSANAGGLFSGAPMPSFASRQNRGTYERAAGAPLNTVSPVPTGQIITGAQVAQWARRGTLTATGVILAAAVLLVIACRWAVVPGDWRFAAFTVGLCLVILLAAQSLIDRVQSMSLSCAAFAGTAIVIGRYAAADATATVSRTLLCAALVAALMVVAVIAGLWLPEAKLKAPIRRALMGLQIVLTVILTVPWMLWLMNAYFYLRHVRH